MVVDCPVVVGAPSVIVNFEVISSSSEVVVVVIKGGVVAVVLVVVDVGVVSAT